MEAGALEDFGWSERWRELFAPYAGTGLVPARVVRQDRGSVRVVYSGGTLRAQVSTRLAKEAANAAVLPAAGDWVGLRLPSGHVQDAERATSRAGVALVEVVLPRRSAFTRADPGKATAGQVLAANVDTVFVVHPTSSAPNVRRIERELAMVWASGAVPVVLLTKADLSDNPDGERDALAESFGVEVLLCSALTGRGMEAVAAAVPRGHTVALIGPSGVGKSTIVNVLVGSERQATRTVRAADGKGRHSTVARELVALPGGGVLLDTPGLRALAVWDVEGGLAPTFADIATLASECRFRDCIHTGEPGCAVIAAVDQGHLPAERLASWQKLRREAESVGRRQDARKQRESKKRGRMLSKLIRQYNKRYR